MAITKTIIKMNHMEAVVKIVNDAASSASTTIALATDLLKSNEELDGTQEVGISFIDTAIANGAEMTITRNSVLIMSAFENTQNIDLAHGADNTNSTHDIVVSLTGKGTAYIRLLKHKGYRPLFRPEQGVY